MCWSDKGCAGNSGMEDANDYDGYRDLMVNVLYTGSESTPPTCHRIRRALLSSFQVV